jgi:hypothetical protein
MVGGYANWTYFINYWGTSPSERDMPVAVRKMPDQDVVYREEELDVDWDSLGASPEAEPQPQPDGGERDDTTSPDDHSDDGGDHQ